MARNALYIPAMGHNLTSPIILQEAGLSVNEDAKRSTDTPTVKDHSIYDDDSKSRIHLQLKGIFSYLNMRKLTIKEMKNWEEYGVIFLTPDSTTWNPHSEHSVAEEAALLDSDGGIIANERDNQSEITSGADVSGLYVEPLPWSRYDELVKK